MHKRRPVITVFLSALLALSLAGLGCKKKEPPPPPAPTEPAAPVAPVAQPLPLDEIQSQLDDLSNPKAALEALKELSETLAGKNATLEVSPADKARAEQMIFDASFVLLVDVALRGGNPKAVAAAAGLEPGPIATPSQALIAFGAKAGEPTVANKSARMVAWLTAEPKERTALPAPDPAAWASFARDDSPVGVAARVAMLQVLDRWLEAFAKADEAHRATMAASALGPFLCANCAKATSTPPGAELAALLYSPENQGYVCAEAAPALAGKAPHAFPAALAAACNAGDYGFMEQPLLASLTAENHLLVRALALALEASRPAPAEAGALAPIHAAKAQAVQDKLSGLGVALRLSWLPVPPGESLEPAALQPPAHLTSGGPQRDHLPFELLVVDEAGIASALRPAASVRAGAVVFEDHAAGQALPGKALIAAEAVEASDQAREEQAKQSGEKIADRDVITEVVSGLSALATVAGPLEARLLAQAPAEARNAAREEAQRTVVLAVDANAEAWLLRRALASAEAAGFPYQLVHKPEAGRLVGDAVLPVVFRGTEGLPEGAAVPTHKRPLVVSVETKQVRVYPPERKLKGVEARSLGDDPAGDWPEGARQTRDPKKRLFSVDYTLPEATQPAGAAVAGIVRKLQHETGAGNVIYLVADAKAPAGRLIEIADALSALPGQPLPLSALEPALRCEGAGCPSQVVVWFPNVRLPEMKEVKVVEPIGPPGFCSQADIQKVVTSRQGRLRYCYESELQLEPTLKGDMTVRFVIGLDGSVSRAAITAATMTNRKVQQCVQQTFSGMRFAKPDGGVCEVRWPLQFRP